MVKNSHYSNAKPLHQKEKKSHKLLIIIAAIIVIAIAVVAVLELTNTTYIFHKKVVPTVIPVTSSGTTSPKTSTGSTSSTPSTGTATSSSSASTKTPAQTGSNDSTATLITPYGDFVSNHHPGANGSPTQEASTCNTSPGATCVINFTNTTTGTSTKLPSEVADADGAATWSWNSSILTTGSWHVSVTATIGSQSKSSDDPTLLEIQ